MGAINDNYRTGKICYTNGKICKYLLPSQFKEYEVLGWYKGTLRKPLSEEQKKRISEGTKKGMNNDIVNNKLRNAAKRNANKERFLNSRRYNWSTKTPAEEYINSFMESLDFIYEYPVNMKEYRKNYPKLKIPTYYRPDFVNPKLKIAIELDGKSHTYKNRDLDIKKENALKYYGYEIYRFKNNEVYNEKFKNTILNIVSKRKEVVL